jgi:hypothetical protein
MPDPEGGRPHVSSQVAKESPRLILVSRKDFTQILIPHMPRHSFAQHLPKIRSQSQIAPFVKL